MRGGARGESRRIIGAIERDQAERLGEQRYRALRESLLELTRPSG